MIIPDQASFISAISCTEGGTLRWMSPELLDPEPFGLKDGRPTKESDCYALGMVIYEVLSGRTPFARCKGTVVIRKVMGGERPRRPRGSRAMWFTDGVWGMLELCWKPQPRDRPNLKSVLRCLEGVKRPLGTLPPAPTVDEGVVIGNNDSSDSTVTTPGTFSISSKTWQTFNHPRGTTGPALVEITQTLNALALAPSQGLPQLTPHIISMILQAEQSPNGSLPFSPADAENLVEILDKVRLPNWFLPGTKLRTTRSCHLPWRIRA